MMKGELLPHNHSQFHNWRQVHANTQGQPLADLTEGLPILW